jgi:hypothetical protein
MKPRTAGNPRGFGTRWLHTLCFLFYHTEPTFTIGHEYYSMGYRFPPGQEVGVK